MTARLILCLAIVTASGCTSGPGPSDNAAYVESIAGFRGVKDRQFGDLPECGPRAGNDCSPIPMAQKATMLPLKYYEVNPGYNVPASLKLSEQRPVYEMPTSTGTLRRMQLVGSLQFTVRGQAMSLGAFVEDGTTRISSLFVPFADLTTGKETYPAGRYLDLEPTATGFYTIDFNKAYNPYCAYNSTYECPYPPPSNRLKVEIRAGEKAPGA